MPRIFFLPFIILVIGLSTATNASPGNPDNWCRNGAFPSEGPDFKIGTITGAKDAKIHFIDDFDLCPDQGGKKCEQRTYVIPGDEILVSRPYKSWTCSAFLSKSKKGKIGEVVGWISSESLQTTNIEMNPPQEKWLGTWTDGYQSIRIEKDPKNGDLKVRGKAKWDGGRGNIHLGHVRGLAKAIGNKLTIVESDCTVSLVLANKYLIATDNRNCGGMNVSFDSVYLKD